MASQSRRSVRHAVRASNGAHARRELDPTADLDGPGRRVGRTSSSEPTPWRMTSGRPSRPPISTAAAPVASSSRIPRSVGKKRLRRCPAGFVLPGPDVAAGLAHRAGGADASTSAGVAELVGASKRVDPLGPGADPAPAIVVVTRSGRRRRGSAGSRRHGRGTRAATPCRPSGWPANGSSAAGVKIRTVATPASASMPSTKTVSLKPSSAATAWRRLRVDRAAVDEHAERIAAAAVRPDEDAQDVEVDHVSPPAARRCRPSARRRHGALSATRWMAATLIDVGDPAVERHRQRLVERHPADLERLGRLRATPHRGPGPWRANRTARSSRDGVRQGEPAELDATSRRLDAGLLAELALGARRARSRRPARRPRGSPMTTRRACSGAGRRAGSGRRRRGDHARRPGSRNGRRRRCPGCRRAGSTSSCQTVIHGFS